MKGILKRPTQIKIKSFWGFFFFKPSKNWAFISLSWNAFKFKHLKKNVGIVSSENILNIFFYVWIRNDGILLLLFEKYVLVNFCVMSYSWQYVLDFIFTLNSLNYIILLDSG